MTSRWDKVKYDFSEMYFSVQTREDNVDRTVKSFKMPSDVTSLQLPVTENWKQLMYTVQHEIDEQIQGEKCVPRTADLFVSDLHKLKEKWYQKICECVQQSFNQEETELYLNSCNINDICAIEVARMLQHFTLL